MNTFLKMKIEFDNAFNKLFFSKDFIDKMIERFHLCPAGLTIDTYTVDSNVTFRCVTKRYGYDNSVKYIPDAAWDDYEILDDKIEFDIVKFMWDYVRINNPKLYEDALDMEAVNVS